MARSVHSATGRPVAVSTTCPSIGAPPFCALVSSHCRTIVEVPSAAARLNFSRSNLGTPANLKYSSELPTRYSARSHFTARPDTLDHDPSTNMPTLTTNLCDIPTISGSIWFTSPEVHQRAGSLALYQHVEPKPVHQPVVERFRQFVEIGTVVHIQPSPRRLVPYPVDQFVHSALGDGMGRLGVPIQPRGRVGARFPLDVR